jgi:uncharacterized protein YfaS (alpha-2-macroglobulin family)
MNKILFRTLLLLIAPIFLMSPSCDKEKNTSGQVITNSQGEKKDPEKKEAMIKYDFSGDYRKHWLKVDSLQNLGLYQSALKEVELIFTEASKENNAPQVVKAVIHKMKYNSYLKEDDYVIAINELNSIAENSKFPLSQLIHSVTADVYWSYYQNNRWKFMNRTHTVNFKNDDIRTWDLKKLVVHVNEHYLLSLTGTDSLKRSKISDFKEILKYSAEAEPLRPTLYDFLAHKALDYFQNPESGLNRPADKFVIGDQNFFGDAETFANISTESNDSLSNLLHATRIFKDLTRFHLRDSDPTALIDLELRRLKFARSQSTNERKELLYISSLERLAEKYRSNSSYSEIQYNCATYYQGLGSGYTVNNPEHRWEIKKALEICEEAITKYPESYGSKLCRSLINTIRSKEMSFVLENGYEPEKIGKFRYNYRNLNQIHFRIVKINWDFYLKNRLYGDELMQEFLKIDPTKSWTQKLENPDDFQSHSVELKLPELEKGQYVILASDNAQFSLTSNAIAYSSFWISDLSYRYLRDDNDGTYDVIVTDRQSGKPLKGIQATIYQNKYNYLSRSYDLIKQESYTTDEFGMCKVKSRGDSRSIYVDLNHGNEHYNEMNQLYMYKPYKREEGYTTTHFFTDRAIYRPGQTVYFKGIRIRHNGDKHTIEAGKTSIVKFVDANHQIVKELKLTTNEYGTFSGSFVAPQGGLNGQMHIEDAFGSRYFSVEEYKRPKFEVEFKPVSGVFRIGEKISIKGQAKSFAGSNVDGAKVQYRVVRSCNVPYWSRYRYGYFPQSASIEITNGVSETDENGEFKIEFTAAEDKSINKKYFPNYTYTIYADVTDISGETQSNQQWVKVGYNAMELSVGIQPTMERTQKNKFKVSTSNLMGEKINANGTIKVSKLIENSGVYRSPLWNRPDMNGFSEEEFRKLFPHDVFKDENDISKLQKGETFLEAVFNTEFNDSIQFADMKTWPAGRYVMEATSIDAFGETVTDLQYFILNDKTDSKAPTKEIWSVTSLKSYCEPGEKAEFLISSAADELSVLYEIEHKGQVVQRQIITLNNSQQRIVIPIEEKHRGNLSVHFSAVKYSRHHSNSLTIVVPFSNKELDVSFETFRDKLQPGQKEEWKVKVKGPKGEKVAAEMLAAMYDASLDQFAPNDFYFSVFNSYYSGRYWYSSSYNQRNSQLHYKNWNDYFSYTRREYSQLNWWGFYYWQGSYYYRTEDYDGRQLTDYYDESDGERELQEVSISSKGSSRASKKLEAMPTTGAVSLSKDDSIEQSAFGFSAGLGDNRNIENKNISGDKSMGDIKARSDLSETAFFYPHLTTNEKGEIIIKFTIPESLTKWNFVSLTHTKDLKTGYLKKETVTQKELMVMPNAPRFLREGDKISFTAKVSNLSGEDLNGTAQLMLFDALTMQAVDLNFKNLNAQVPITIKQGQSAALSWDLEIPSGIGAVTYRVVAKAKNHTDGEEMTIPVLSNRMLVTESMPLPSKGIGTKEFKFEKLVNSGNSSSIQNHKLTLEYTSNPAWYAIQALPYMMEYPYECAEQIFTRYYANSLASSIVRSNPKIKQVFDSWKESSPEAFLSNLEKNQELKSLMLEETPWVLDAKNENERKKRVALLFDLNKMDNQLERTLNKLEKLQVTNGGWPWFPGMEDNRYITQHIITGMGHLHHLGVKDVQENKRTWNMIQKGIQYLDDCIIKDYNWLKSHDAGYLTNQRISEIHIQYLYARSYFVNIPVQPQLKEAFDYYQKQAQTYWKNFNIYNEGMIALQAKRYGIEQLPEQIIASLKERAILHEEMGMYWKDNVTGYYWYQAPIETQALLIEAFDEVTNDQAAVEEMKVWLLKQKQTTDWKTTKATAEACYALLLKGTSLLMNTEQVEIKMNGRTLDPKAIGAKVEAGTGYFKTSWDGDDIKPEMGQISVTRRTEGVSWGAVYWQYFEDLDKITTHETPLKLSKKLFLVQNTASGPVMTPIVEGTVLNPGDKVRIRIELRSDRDMEYVHMKDMRASGFEPLNVFSQYKWQDGLGYYESTKDASTNFFMDYMRKGTYVFEYDVRVTHYGEFSNGIATIQCMYAPEFTSHSEGIRVEVKEKGE